MEAARLYLESSSISGVNHILASTKIYIRLFWITVVIAGFVGSGVLIHQSFEEWDEDPVKTTIDTLPIREMLFPKITVCPPKNTFTNLNYHIMMTENVTMDKETRDEILNYALELVNQLKFKEVMKNLSILEEENRYSNWYHGYTRVDLSSYKFHYKYGLYNSFWMNTGAVNGSVSTRNFEEKYDKNDVEKRIDTVVEIITPCLPELQEGELNISLHLELEQNRMNVGIERFEMRVGQNWEEFGNEIFIEKKYPLQSSNIRIRINFSRFVSDDDVKKVNIKKMPGFKVKWYYSGDIPPYIDQNSADMRDEFRRFVNLLSTINGNVSMDKFWKKVAKQRTSFLQQNVYSCDEEFIPIGYIQNNTKGATLFNIHMFIIFGCISKS